MIPARTRQNYKKQSSFGYVTLNKTLHPDKYKGRHKKIIVFFIGLTTKMGRGWGWGLKPLSKINLAKEKN